MPIASRYPFTPTGPEELQILGGMNPRQWLLAKVLRPAHFTETDLGNTLQDILNALGAFERWHQLTAVKLTWRLMVIVVFAINSVHRRYSPRADLLACQALSADRAWRDSVAESISPADTVRVVSSMT